MKRLMPWLVSCTLLCWAVAVMGAEDAALKELRAKWEGVGKAVKDLTIRQEIKMAQEGPPGPIETTVFRKGQKTRTEMQLQGMTMIMIFDGADTWAISPMGKMKMPQRSQQPTDMDLGHAWPEDAHLAGTETVSGRDCYVIECKDPHSDGTTRLWLDRNSPTIVKSEFKKDANSAVAVYSDFRKIQGDYEMGFKCDLTMNGRPAGTLTIKSFKVNTGLADEIFDPNSAAASKPVEAAS
jgi:outer membrane lipoprotein-sorting protein